MKIFDKNGREILPFDTLKIYHFTGIRRKKHFMYKFVSGFDGRFLKVEHLDSKRETYHLLMDDKKNQDIEIVQGYGHDGKSFEDRVKS